METSIGLCTSFALPSSSLQAPPWRSLFIIRLTSSKNSPPTFPASDPRLSLLFAISSQAALQTQRTLQNLTSEAVKYVNPRRGEIRNLEEALMTVPDLETIPYTVLRRDDNYEVRQLESYVVAETVMPGKSGFDFYGSSQGFNTLATYLFGKNRKRQEMEMTTPVITSKSQSEGEKMDMTTPVISRQVANGGQWQMAFVMPKKYADDLPLPIDDSVKIRRVPPKIIAVTAFSGYVTDEEVKQRERKLRSDIEKDTKIKVVESAQVEVSQYNPPFTPPFSRRNEVALEVVQVDS